MAASVGKLVWDSPSSSFVGDTGKGQGSAQNARGWNEKMLEPAGDWRTLMEQMAASCPMGPAAPTKLAEMEKGWDD